MGEECRLCRHPRRASPETLRERGLFLGPAIIIVTPPRAVFRKLTLCGRLVLVRPHLLPVAHSGSPVPVFLTAWTGLSFSCSLLLAWCRLSGGYWLTGCRCWCRCSMHHYWELGYIMQWKYQTQTPIRFGENSSAAFVQMDCGARNNPDPFYLCGAVIPESL